jgi:hypothetical protein
MYKLIVGLGKSKSNFMQVSIERMNQVVFCCCSVFSWFKSFYSSIAIFFSFFGKNDKNQLKFIISFYSFLFIRDI